MARLAKNQSNMFLPWLVTKKFHSQSSQVITVVTNIGKFLKENCTGLWTHHWVKAVYMYMYHGHTSVFLHCSKILKLQDLITHRTMVMLYKANNHCLEGRVQAFFEPTAAVHKHDTRQSKLFYVKKANTTHRLLSITVRGIHVWNGLACNIRQLPSLQQFKKSLKSTLLSSYL